jgi:hypothetical protein
MTLRIHLICSSKRLLASRLRSSSAYGKALSRNPNRCHHWTRALALMLTVCFEQHSMAEAATIQVNTTQQGRTNGQCSLQEAIYASEFKASTAIASLNPYTPYTTGCTAGSGNDTIVLLSGAIFTFDHFWAGDARNVYGPTATPVVVSKITIEGNGATLQWVDRFMPVNSRLFVVAERVDENVVIRYPAD